MIARVENQVVKNSRGSERIERQAVVYQENLSGSSRYYAITATASKHV